MRPAAVGVRVTVVTLVTLFSTFLAYPENGGAGGVEEGEVHSCRDPGTGPGWKKRHQRHQRHQRHPTRRHVCAGGRTVAVMGADTRGGSDSAGL